jgi:hypothetical protein
MSEINPAVVAGTRIAVEFLRVWTQQDPLTAAKSIDAVLSNPNGPDVHTIIAGQLIVGKLLVAMLAQARGAVTPDDLGVKASEIHRELYRYLFE